MNGRISLKRRVDIFLHPVAGKQFTKMKNDSSLNVFVLDDDPTYRNILVCYLESLGHRATGFQSANECLLSMSQRPDVVLLDHNLEGEQKGVDVLRFIKQEHPAVSVIYVTGEESVTLVSDVFRSGSEDFIGKDSASLLRLKLKLDQLIERKIQRAKDRKRNQRLIVAGAVVFAAYIIVQYLLLA